MNVPEGQRPGQRMLEMQAKQARRNNNGEGRKRAVGLFIGGHFGSEGGFERRLEQAKMDFTWR